MYTVVYIRITSQLTHYYFLVVYVGLSLWWDVERVSYRPCWRRSVSTQPIP